MNINLLSTIRYLYPPIQQTTIYKLLKEEDENQELKQKQNPGVRYSV